MMTQSGQYTYRPTDSGRKYRGVTIVAALHILLVWAVISGTAKKGLDIIKKPLQAVVIQEVVIPPPPPPVKEIKPPEIKTPRVEAPPPPPFVPPPEVAQPTAAPAIASTAMAPPVPAVIAPPAEAFVPAKSGPARSDIRVACPTQVEPEMPKRALQDGTNGTVRAQALVKDGAVREVTILSGPRVFHAAVKAAMMQYKCISGNGEVMATQEFNFKIE
jgi:protein TonB